MLENNTRIADDAEIVDEAILSRRSVRAFLPDMVDDDIIRAILAVAARAPSGTNMQPWRVYVTKGETKQRITDAILNSGIRAEKADWDEYRYYPTQFFEPYLTRRRANGFGLYGALGIGRREVDKMRAQHDRNFVFFDAPVGMIFTIDRRLNRARGSTTACSCRTSWSRRGAGACTPARRPPSRPITGRSGRCSTFPTKKSSSAAWRSAMRTRRSPKTIFAPTACRWKSG